MADTQFGGLVRHLRAPRAPGGEHSDRQLLHEFAAHNDPAAFAALVGRHGPLVLRVCRGVLRHEQDAEDAFQATFLVLARNVAAVRDPGALGSWLHGVAYRTSLAAKRAAARRRAHEARAAAPAPRDPAWGAAWREVEAVLDEEVARLPERLRAPFLLCCVDGLGRAEAAGAWA